MFFVLGGFFLTNAILAELTGGKLFKAPTIWLGWLTLEDIPLSIGVIPWPVVFVTTDLINEYYGKEGVRKLTFLAVAMISYCFALLYLAMLIPAWEHSPVPSEAFATVFGQSMWIIVGSLTAFLTAQFVDVIIFVAFHRRTGHRFLWLRATGSTVVSQLIDTFIVAYIGFVIPEKVTIEQYVRMASGNYAYKLMIAILVTPVIYLAHSLIEKFLAGDASNSDAEPA